MKSILMSIRPEWCEKIINGSKTVEIRKTKPKIETPFKVYVYCTLPKKKFGVGSGLYFSCDDLYKDKYGNVKYGDSLELMTYEDGEYSEDNFLNGKVIGEFICDKIIYFGNVSFDNWIYLKGDHFCGLKDIVNYNAQMSEKELHFYSNGNACYGWHIKDFVLYDKPKALDKFYTKFYTMEGIKYPIELTRAPQSWCYVEDICK